MKVIIDLCVVPVGVGVSVSRHVAACQQVLEQLQHSRNLLLVDAELAASTPLRQCASTRRLASQPGTFCIERLLEPYQSLLERQLSSLYNQRQA